jgi:sodium/proline symporter
MVQKLFNPWIADILLASILSAIMSTIDSQLLVSSSAVTEDLYKKFLKKNPSEKELVWIGRISVVIISLIATVLAFNPENTVLGLVSYAWGGLGAAFGPLILGTRKQIIDPPCLSFVPSSALRQRSHIPICSL